ncbi:Protein of unknown function [Streptomyces sp. 2224.1]|uniref:DUF4231 domain-containing protein n=1 Tax=unclassified Streptomyces TaxID=2593676 RepID=UPI000888CEB1|nr:MULTISPECIES: DUF4231 domain-containing protein [unclassified Streptomyces]PBC81232.1 uncharacterized protein DUF4231 [Streptomyces sp. 2321.6]SDR55905.1 Protein of unknown function [Streptomyces sp. KS_16]SEC06638.1 Protein of unknown function [Streptomyces sp. 2133.1]SNC64380.1 Protein of unknown function [Streptomyces sp. 2114.4]SED22647.1 Protein of unknown function [Streptomyces sp. 2224.1]
MERTTEGLRDDDLPVVFRSSDAASLIGQRRYVRGTMWRLLLAVSAALCGALDHRAALIGLVTVFVATVCVEVWLLAERPEQAWYDGRALAESTKTLAWRYAVGGAPFPADLPPAEAHRRFHERLETLLREAPATSLAPVGSIAATDAMTALRSRSFADRKRAYLRSRIEDQQRWYTTKATGNITRARQWRLLLIAIEGLGLAAAILRLTGLLTFDLAGVLAAVLGAGSAWFAVRQYETLGRAYTFAATELSVVHQRLALAGDESWAQEVADAEEAISREHTMWRASRGAS